AATLQQPIENYAWARLRGDRPSGPTRPAPSDRLLQSKRAAAHAAAPPGEMNLVKYPSPGYCEAMALCFALQTKSMLRVKRAAELLLKRVATLSFRARG